MEDINSKSEHLKKKVNNLVNTLRAWREKNLLSQEKAAQLLGVTRAYFNQIENGRKPGAEFVNNLQQLLGEHETTEFDDTRIQDSAGIYGPRSLIKKRREELGLSIKQLAVATGYQAGIIRNIEEGSTRGVSEKLLVKLAKVLDLPLEALMGGSDTPALTGYGITHGAKPNVTTAPGIIARTIPLISWAQAGTAQAWEDIYEHEGIVAYNSKDPKAVAISIRGDSMEPEYKEGTIAIIYPSVQAKTGDLVIARLSDGSVYFKRLQINGDQYTFVSLNPIYPPITVDRKKVAKIAPVGATQKTEL